MEQHLEDELTWGDAAGIWWSLWWRQMMGIFVAIIPAFLFGFVMALVGHFLGLAQIAMSAASVVFSLITSVFASIWIIKRIFGKTKRLGAYRVVLVKSE
jgi:hypothetical protein